MKPLDKVKWMADVAKDRKLPNSALHVAVCLCDCLNSQTGQCNPSVETIIEFTGLSRRSVQSSIKELESSGHIEISEKGNGRNNRTSYALIKGAKNDSEKGANISPFKNIKGAKNDTERVQKTTIKGAKNDIPPTPPYKEEPMKEPVKGISEGENTQKNASKAKAEKWLPPSWLNTEAWGEFEQHRKEIREPLTDLARKKAANQLQDLTSEEQQRCIDMTIQNRWKGLFPDKVRGKQQRGTRNDDFSSKEYSGTPEHEIGWLNV